MKSDDKSPEQKVVEQRLILLLIVGFTTVCASFAGLMIVLFAGATLEFWTGIRFAWWSGMLVGGLLGFVTVLLQTLAMFKRSDAYTRQATAIGLAPLSESDTNDVARAVKRLIPESDVRFWDCHFRADANARIVIGDMGLESSQMDGSSHSTELQQTCLYIEFTDFVFPEFQLQPEGRRPRFLEALTGSLDIDFADSPDFSKQYFLSGRPDEIIRQLFDKPVRDELQRVTLAGPLSPKNST